MIMLAIQTLKPQGLTSVQLLLITGTLVGLNFPLAKIAGMAGISPLIWAMIISLGASLTLLPVLLIKKQLSFPKGQTLRYVIISSLISCVLPNILIFTVITHVGVGYTGLMFTLSPVFTLFLASLFRFSKPSKMTIIGIMFGFIGAIIVSITRGLSPEAPHLMWVILALLIPVLLASANIYRTMDWPKGESADILAFWSHTIAVIIFMLLLFIFKNEGTIRELSLAPLPVLLQMLIAGITFPFAFRLQAKGGAVLLSQIGYVAAAVGMGSRYILLK
jgi:drug/metabolite transporter (DMT)-like permease